MFDIPYLEILSGAANLFTIITSVIAIYVYLANRKKIAATLQMLLNYSFQSTLGELKEKLERLNEYNANEPTHEAEIRGILHEIAGQIRGNNRLLLAVPKLSEKIERLANNKKLTETAKRSLVSELRETLKNIQVNSFDITSGNHHE